MSPHKRNWREVRAALFSGRMLAAFVMGFASGLPLLLTGSLLQAWMKESAVDLSTIGLFALVGLPYTLKFVWAPLMDRYVPPFLGRRRGWLFVWQLCLSSAIALLALSDPRDHLLVVALASLLLSFFSASQDIVIDAYRRESLADDEQGMGASLYVGGYRVGMLLASGGGLILADLIGYRGTYLLMAAAMLACVIATLSSREPALEFGAPKTLRAAVVEPFIEYFRRQDAIAILLFILLYKIGDIMASQMTTPFYLDLGFTKTEIGAIVKLFGFWATIAGSMVGGLLLMRIGLFAGLMGFGVLQGVSTAGFAWLTTVGHQDWALAVVVTLENFSAGLGTAAFVGFMASLTNKRFTATQYALLSSFMGMPRIFAAAPTGYMVEALDWAPFFLLCAALAAPGLLLLYWLKRRDAGVLFE